MKKLIAVLTVAAALTFGAFTPTAYAGNCIMKIKPICAYGSRPVCVCSGTFGNENCHYVCMGG